MARTILTATTAYGIFTRQTASPYKFVAIGQAADGGPVHTVGAAGMARRRNGGEPPRYIARWSSTEAGAARNVETYDYQKLTLLGIYPVDSSTRV